MIRFSPKKALWFWMMGGLSLLYLPGALSISTVALGTVFGFLCFLLGHTVGLHRGVLHRSFAMGRTLRALFLYCFVLIGLGGPLSWMRVHGQRDRWQNQAQAPAWFRYDHGLLQDCWWNLHTIYIEPENNDVRPEDQNEPWLKFLEHTWWLHVLASFVALYLLLGWEHLVVSGFTRVFLGIVGHWYIGFEAHKSGKQAYIVEGACESGRNRWLLGLLSLGEGFHNNHHAFPESAKIGQRSTELDAGWWVICAFRAAGLVWNVQTYENQIPRGAHPAQKPAQTLAP